MEGEAASDASFLFFILHAELAKQMGRKYPERMTLRYLRANHGKSSFAGLIKASPVHCCPDWTSLSMRCSPMISGFLQRSQSCARCR